MISATFMKNSASVCVIGINDDFLVRMRHVLTISVVFDKSNDSYNLLSDTKLFKLEYFLRKAKNFITKIIFLF